MPSLPSPIPRQPRLGIGRREPSTMTIQTAPRPGTGRAVKNYDAARQDRLTGDWQVSRLSADAELQGKLPIIRSRARDLERNDPYIENYLKLRENNVVGHDGFTLQMKVKLSEELDPETGEMVIKYDTAANRAIEKAWKSFCRKQNFLTTRDMDSTDSCKLVERTVGRDGELLIRKVKGYPNRHGFAIQLMEADFLDDQYIDFRGVACNCPEERTFPNGRPYPLCKTGQHQVRMGVELHGDWMFPVAYWLLADHPGDYMYGNQFSVRRTRVPVEEIIHPFVHKRIGQTRGVPAMVAAMLLVQMRGGYDEATLVKARAAAQKMGFLEKEIPDSIAEQYMDEWSEAFKQGPTINGEPGQIEELPIGVKFKPWDPQEPTGNYVPFQKSQLRGTACAMGVSYTSLCNDLEGVNFSSGRLGALEEREGYRGGQEFFIANILEEIFPDWLQCAMLTGEVDLPFSRFEEFTEPEAVDFGGRSFPWVDPEKDINAAILAVDAGFTTRADVIREGTAGDFEEVTGELGRENRIRAAAGVQTPAEQDRAVQQAAAAAPDPAGGDDEDDNPDKGLALKRDGWVTINGRPVHFGPDGKVDSGGGTLLASAKQKARSAFADKAGEAAHAAGHAAHASPSPATHAAAAGAHRAASSAHEDAAQSGPRADEHAGHAAMHQEKAEKHDGLAQTSAPRRQTRTFQMPFAPNGAQDALDHIVDQGGIASRKVADAKGALAANRADYDDAPELRGVYHHAVFGGTMRPDQMAQILHENHGVGDGSVGGMYSAIGDAIQTRQAYQKEGKRQEVLHQQANRFDKEAFKPRKGDEAVHVGNLSVGDVLTIHGEKVRVKDIDPDTMDVTLQDHTRYGAQKVQDGQVIYAEHMQSADHDDWTATKAASDEPRDANGKWIGDGGPSAGAAKQGNWQSLGLPSAENLDPIARPVRMGRRAAMDKLATPYAKQDPLGNTVGFGQRLRDHLEDHIREGDHARPGFLAHMEAAVENPAEIWAQNTPQGPRLRHIAAFTAPNGTRSFAVVSHQLGETRAEIITGTPKTHQSINRMRAGKLLYQRPKRGA